MEEEQVDYKRHLLIFAGYFIALAFTRLIRSESGYIIVLFIGTISVIAAVGHLFYLIAMCIERFMRGKYNHALIYLMLCFLLVISYAGSCALLTLG